MSWLTKFLNSNIGLKVLMALTGFVFVGFVLGHMLGNLQIFIGAEALNKYGAMLQGMGDILWIIRGFLLVSILIHIYSATVLTLRSWSARSVQYDKKLWLGESYAVRTMKYGGVLIAIFIVYHLLQFTVGVHGISPEGFAHCEPNTYGALECQVYANVVAGFSNVWVSLFYVITMIMLGLHLAHGAWSMFRTLGLDSPRWDAVARVFALTVAFLVTVGNCAIPLAVLFKLVH